MKPEKTPGRTKARGAAVTPPAGSEGPTEAGSAASRASTPRRFAFTDRGIKALRPPAREQVNVWDSTLPGFGLRLYASGARTWVLFYRHGRKQRLLKLGVYPSVTLKAARKLAHARQADVTQGADPVADRAEERGAATFGELARLYLEKHAAKKRTEREDRRIMEREILPRFRTLHAADVKRAAVIALLDDVAARPAPIMSNRVLALLRKVYNFGIERGLVESNPCAIVRPVGIETRRERVLTDQEIRGLWRGLEGEYIAGGRVRGESAANPAPRAKEAGKEAGEALALVAAVRLMLLTAQRRGEVLRMRWEEITEDSPETPAEAPAEGNKPAPRFSWTIPAESAKNGRAHRVPLSPEALEILESIPRSCAWVLPGRLVDENGTPRAHVTNVERAIDRARERQSLEHFTPHDLRRTAASSMTALGIPRLTVKKILNHVDRDVTGIYDRHSYDPEKRTALEAWGRRVREIVSGEARGGAVVPFRRPAHA